MSANFNNVSINSDSNHSGISVTLKKAPPPCDFNNVSINSDSNHSGISVTLKAPPPPVVTPESPKKLPSSLLNFWKNNQGHPSSSSSPQNTSSESYKSAVRSFETRSRSTTADSARNTTSSSGNYGSTSSSNGRRSSISSSSKSPTVSSAAGPRKSYSAGTGRQAASPPRRSPPRSPNRRSFGSGSPGRAIVTSVRSHWSSKSQNNGVGTSRASSVSRGDSWTYSTSGNGSLNTPVASYQSTKSTNSGIIRSKSQTSAAAVSYDRHVRPSTLTSSRKELSADTSVDCNRSTISTDSHYSRFNGSQVSASSRGSYYSGGSASSPAGSRSVGSRSIGSKSTVNHSNVHSSLQESYDRSDSVVSSNPNTSIESSSASNLDTSMESSDSRPSTGSDGVANQSEHSQKNSNMSMQSLASASQKQDEAANDEVQAAGPTELLVQKEERGHKNNEGVTVADNEAWDEKKEHESLERSFSPDQDEKSGVTPFDETPEVCRPLRSPSPGDFSPTGPSRSSYNSFEERVLATIQRQNEKFGLEAGQELPVADHSHVQEDPSVPVEDVKQVNASAAEGAKLEVPWTDDDIMDLTSIHSDDAFSCSSQGNRHHVLNLEHDSSGFLKSPQKLNTSGQSAYSAAAASPARTEEIRNTSHSYDHSQTGSADFNRSNDTAKMLANVISAAQVAVTKQQQESESNSEHHGHQYYESFDRMPFQQQQVATDTSEFCFSAHSDVVSTKFMSNSELGSPRKNKPTQLTDSFARGKTPLRSNHQLRNNGPALLLSPSRSTKRADGTPSNASPRYKSNGGSATESFSTAKQSSGEFLPPDSPQTSRRSKSELDTSLTSSTVSQQTGSTSSRRRKSNARSHRQERRRRVDRSDNHGASFDSDSVSTVEQEDFEHFLIGAFMDFVSPPNDEGSTYTEDSAASSATESLHDVPDKSADTRARKRLQRRKRERRGESQSSFLKLKEWWKSELVAAVVKDSASSINSATDADTDGTESRSLHVEQLINSELQNALAGDRGSGLGIREKEVNREASSPNRHRDSSSGLPLMQWLEKWKKTLEAAQQGDLVCGSAETVGETVQGEDVSFDTLDDLMQAFSKSKVSEVESANNNPKTNTAAVSEHFRSVYEQLNQGLLAVVDRHTEAQNTATERTLHGDHEKIDPEPRTVEMPLGVKLPDVNESLNSSDAFGKVELNDSLDLLLSEEPGPASFADPSLTPSANRFSVSPDGPATVLSLGLWHKGSPDFVVPESNLIDQSYQSDTKESGCDAPQSGVVGKLHELYSSVIPRTASAPLRKEKESFYRTASAPLRKEKESFSRLEATGSAEMSREIKPCDVPPSATPQLALSEVAPIASRDNSILDLGDKSDPSYGSLDLGDIDRSTPRSDEGKSSEGCESPLAKVKVSPPSDLSSDRPAKLKKLKKKRFPRIRITTAKRKKEASPSRQEPNKIDRPQSKIRITTSNQESISEDPAAKNKVHGTNKLLQEYASPILPATDNHEASYESSKTNLTAFGQECELSAHFHDHAVDETQHRNVSSQNLSAHFDDDHFIYVNQDMDTSIQDQADRTPILGSPPSTRRARDSSTSYERSERDLDADPTLLEKPDASAGVDRPRTVLNSLSPIRLAQNDNIDGENPSSTVATTQSILTSLPSSIPAEGKHTTRDETFDGNLSVLGQECELSGQFQDTDELDRVRLVTPESSLVERSVDRKHSPSPKQDVSSPIRGESIHDKAASNERVRKDRSSPRVLQRLGKLKFIKNRRGPKTRSKPETTTKDDIGVRTTTLSDSLEEEQKDDLHTELEVNPLKTLNVSRVSSAPPSNGGDYVITVNERQGIHGNDSPERSEHLGAAVPEEGFDSTDLHTSEQLRASKRMVTNIVNQEERPNVKTWSLLGARKQVQEEEEGEARKTRMVASLMSEQTKLKSSSRPANDRRSSRSRSAPRALSLEQPEPPRPENNLDRESLASSPPKHSPVKAKQVELNQNDTAETLLASSNDWEDFSSNGLFGSKRDSVPAKSSNSRNAAKNRNRNSLLTKDETLMNGRPEIYTSSESEFMAFDRNVYANSIL